MAAGGFAGCSRLAALVPMTFPKCQTVAATANAPARKPQPAPAAKMRIVSTDVRDNAARGTGFTR
jgi:hypothetical protein